MISLGALLAFELARHLRAVHEPQPSRLFISGTSAPQLPPAAPPIHALPDRELIDALRKLNGTPEEVLDNAELMQLILPFCVPILRSMKVMFTRMSLHSTARSPLSVVYRISR
jgi:surfactin synthase thioesterase subunit